jgi:predicted phosphodiesterase
MYLHKENLKYIKETIKTFNIKEVWVCWGDNIIKEAKYDMVKMLRLQNIFMFTFWELTKKNNPSHPLYKSYKDIDSSKRRDYYWQKEKILILGDSHGEKDIIEQIRFKENPDLIIHTGDIYNFDTKRSEIENEWIETNIDYLTLGNHDINAKTPQDFNSSEEYDKYMYDLDPYYLLKNKYILFFIQNYNVLLTHSFEYEPNYATWYNKFKPRQNQNEEDWNIHFSKIITSVNIKLVICGHTHIPYIKEKKDLIILNPGALSGKNKTYIIGTYNKKKEEFSFKIKTWQ